MKRFVYFFFLTLISFFLVGCTFMETTTRITTDSTTTVVNTTVEITPDTTTIEILEYQIFYELDGGFFEGDLAPTNYTTVSDSFIIPEPIKVGYLFAGWTFGENNIPTKNLTISQGSMTDYYLVANWFDLSTLSYDATYTSIPKDDVIATIYFFTIYRYDSFVLVTGSKYMDSTISFIVDCGTIIYLENSVIELDFTDNEANLYIKINGDSVVFCNQDGTSISDEGPTKEGAYEIVEFYSEDLEVGYGYFDLSYYENADDLHSFYDALLSDCKQFSLSTTLYQATDGSNLFNTYYLVDYDLTIDEGLMVFKVFVLDHPEYFWLSNMFDMSGASLNIYITTEYQSYQAREAVTNGLLTIFEDLDSIITIEMSELDIAYYLHDYIISRIDYAYETDGVTPQDDYWAHNIEGVVLERGAVCEGYAEMYKILLDYYGIYNILVTGEIQGERHEFNLVSIEGTFYIMDLTLDDLGENMSSITYFGMGYTSIVDSHKFDTPDDYRECYLYRMPVISEEDISLVHMNYNGNDIGWFISIDSAFDSMTDSSGEYILDLADYIYYDAISPARRFIVRTSEFPEVQSIHFVGYNFVDSSGYSYLSSFLFESSEIFINSSVIFENTSLCSNGSVLNVRSNIVTFSGENSNLYKTKLVSDVGGIVTVDVEWEIRFYDDFDIDEFVLMHGRTELWGTHYSINLLNYISDDPFTTIRIYEDVIFKQYHVETLSIESIFFSEDSNRFFLTIYKNNTIQVSIGDIYVEPCEYLYIPGIVFILDSFVSFPTITLSGDSNAPIQLSLQESATTDIEDLLGKTLFSSLNLGSSQLYIDDQWYGDLKNLIEKDESGNFILCKSSAIIIDDDSILLSVVSLCIDDDSCNIVIPEGVIDIKAEAFTGALRVKSITLPSSLVTFEYVYYYSNHLRNLENIYVDVDNPYFTSVDGVLFSKDLQELLYYPNAKIGETYAIPLSTQSIGNSAFMHNTTLEIIIISDSVLSIGDYAFRFSSIQEAFISISVTDIGINAFCNINGLTIYAEATSMPEGWHPQWISSEITSVVWGYLY